MGLDLTLLALEAESRPEADIFREAGPHESGGQQPSGSSDTRMRTFVKRQEQLMA